MLVLLAASALSVFHLMAQKEEFATWTSIKATIGISQRWGISSYAEYCSMDNLKQTDRWNINVGTFYNLKPWLKLEGRRKHRPECYGIFSARTSAMYRIVQRDGQLPPLPVESSLSAGTMESESLCFRRSVPAVRRRCVLYRWGNSFSYRLCLESFRKMLAGCILLSSAGDRTPAEYSGNGAGNKILKRIGENRLICQIVRRKVPPQGILRLIPKRLGVSGKTSGHFGQNALTFQ